MSDQPRRITLDFEGTRRLALVPQTLEELLDLASTKFSAAIKFFCLEEGGAEIDDLLLLRDGDVLLCSDATISFPSSSAPPSPTPSSSPSSPTSSVSLIPPLILPAGFLRLNVGGTIFLTTKETVRRCPDSMLYRMLCTEHWSNHMDASGAIMIDRSPRFFEPLLGFLRTGQLLIDDDLTALLGVLEEAKYFNIVEVAELLEPRIASLSMQLSDFAPLKRRDLVKMLLLTPSTAPLRCQGLNFEGADLSNLDLSNISFKFANFKNCIMTNCNLQHCNFEQASMHGVRLDGSNLLGCSMQRVNLECASLRNCNFCDPSQCSVTSLEGANLKLADLEDSNLSCANLRVATLKAASLKNCTLRCACLAGVDLESCNLTGCNLQGANLRGANTVNAIFHKMPEALHMSQSMFAQTAGRSG